MKFSLVLALFLGTSSAIKLGNKLTHGGPNIVQYIEVKTSPEEEGVVLAMLPKDNIYAQNKDDDKTVNPAAENDKKPKDDDEPPKEEKKEEAPKDLKSGPPPKKEKEPEPEPEKKERKVPEGGLLPHFINPDDHEPNMNRTEKPDTFAHQYIRSPAEKSRRINEDIKDLQHCPYYAEESDKLVNGRTVAIPYPKPGYNCKEYSTALTPSSLVQTIEEPEAEAAPKAEEGSVEEEGKPNNDPKRKPQDLMAKPPAKKEEPEEEKKEKKYALWKGHEGWDYYHTEDHACRMMAKETHKGNQELPTPEEHQELAKEAEEAREAEKEEEENQDGKPTFEHWRKLADSQHIQNNSRKIREDIMCLEKCPDFNERFTLVDGRTRAIPYPQSMYNCHQNFAF